MRADILKNVVLRATLIYIYIYVYMQTKFKKNYSIFKTVNQDYICIKVQSILLKCYIVNCRSLKLAFLIHKAQLELIFLNVQNNQSFLCMYVCMYVCMSISEAFFFGTQPFQIICCTLTIFIFVSWL